MLFVELALIRWLGANVLYLAYFSNVVLLGSFLGIGAGFLWASRAPAGRCSRSPRRRSPRSSCSTGVLDVQVGIAGGDLIFFGLDTSGPPRWVVLPVVFVAVAAVMACLGDGVARVVRRGSATSTPTSSTSSAACSASIAFALLSFVLADPVVWGAIAAVGLLVAIRPRRAGDDRRSSSSRCVALVVALGVESAEADTTWTPYYKVHTDADRRPGGVVAEVNGIPTWLQFRAVGNPLYETVYERIDRRDPGDVLIIGAGSGNDVAVALARGATSVDAVEIDGHLLDARPRPSRPPVRRPPRRHPRRRRPGVPRGDRSALGHDPARPARLADAAPGPVVGAPGELPVHRRGRRVVPRPPRRGGTFAMYNYYREPWLVDRYAATLDDVFGKPPCVSTPPGTILSVLVVSADPAAVDVPAGRDVRPAPRRRPTRRPTTTRSRTCARRASPASTCSPSPSSLGLSLHRRARSPAGRCARCAVSRPVLHGRGVPAAGDEERRAVRPAVRHDLVRQRLRVRRRAAVGAAGRGGQQAGAHPAARAGSTPPCSAALAVNWLVPGRALLDLPVVAPPRRRRRPGVHADLPRQPRVRRALPRHRQGRPRRSAPTSRGDARRPRRVPRR